MSRAYQAYARRVKEAREAFARRVCNGEVSPLSLLYLDEPFKVLTHTLDPNFFTPLSLQSFREDCLKIYEEQREKAKEILSKLDGRISISVDSPLFDQFWDTFDKEFCINAHFIDNDWKLQKWVIKYCVDGDDARDRDCAFYEIDAVMEALYTWEIGGKTLSLTGHSELAKSVKQDLQGRREILFHVQCSCDIITEMVKSVFEMINDIIDKVRMLEWHRTLPLWYLTTSKLKSALELNAVGKFSPENIRDYDEVPSEEEWEKVRIICRITDRIYEITKPLYEAKRLTANLFLPHLVEIHVYLAQESASSDQFVKSVAHQMLKTYTMYWNDMYLMLSLAAFLDPRYKMRYIEFSFSKLQCEEKAVNVLETIRKIYESSFMENNEKEYLMSDSSSDDEEYEEEESDEEEEEEADEEETDMIIEKQPDNLMEKLELLYCSVQSENDQKIKSDLDYYLEESVLKWTENFSILHWWKDNGSKYPRLSRMARDFLAVPMSVSSSNEAYYTEPRSADFNMTSLKPELVNALMCTRSWKFGYNYNETNQEQASDVTVTARRC